MSLNPVLKTTLDALVSTLQQNSHTCNNTGMSLIGQQFSVLATQLSIVIQTAEITQLTELVERLYATYDLMYDPASPNYIGLTAEQNDIITKRSTNLRAFYKLFPDEAAAERIAKFTTEVYTTCPYGKIGRTPKMEFYLDPKYGSFTIRTKARDPLFFKDVAFDYFDYNQSTYPHAIKLLDNALKEIGYFEVDRAQVDLELSDLIESYYERAVVEPFGNLYGNYEPFTFEHDLCRRITRDNVKCSMVSKPTVVDKLAAIRFSSFKNLHQEDSDNPRLGLTETATFQFNGYNTDKVVFIYNVHLKRWIPMFEDEPLLEYMLDRLVKVLKKAVPVIGEPRSALDTIEFHLGIE